MNVVFKFDALAVADLANDTPTSAGASPVRAFEDLPRRRALLIGQPNVGKSVVFGALTGTYVTVSNYPGTTVEITRGRTRLGDHSWEVVDSPGTHNLVPMSEDEAVTRDLLLSEDVDALVQVGDAKNLARTLLLSLQLAELGIPFCLDLNMADEARARGLVIDIGGLERQLQGVCVRVSTATEGEGLVEIRAAIGRVSEGRGLQPSEPLPLPCAPVFPCDVESAIQSVQAALGPSRVAKRALATMLLASTPETGLAVPGVSDDARRIAREQARAIEQARGVPMFAVLTRLRVERARAIVRSVQTREVPAVRVAHARAVPWVLAAVVGAASGIIGATTVETSMGHLHPNEGQQGAHTLLGLDKCLLLGRIPSPGYFFAVGVGALVGLLSSCLVRRHERARAAAWKLLVIFAASSLVFDIASAVAHVIGLTSSPQPIYLATLCGLVLLALGAHWGDSADSMLAGAFGRAATHPIWGLPILFVVLRIAYQVVGVFGAGTAVNFVEDDVFGSVAAQASIESVSSASALEKSGSFAPEGALRLVVTDAPKSGVRVAAQVKTGSGFVAQHSARIDIIGHAARAVVIEPGVVEVHGDLRGAEARVWSGHVNRSAYALFAWLGIPLLTAFIVGPYGLLTMGITYAVAIVLPVVATFFFVFSILEDSGYLPRLAVMANRTLRTMGLNGKAVLPMVLGLGCDTMATLTTRILATRKERTLVTLLLALGIPCSSQLSVIFALMQRTSFVATCVWMAVVVSTLLGVGWIAARLLPGDTSDFLLEMPPIRRPVLSNIIAKTLARIEWYLREAVPLFLVGTALLFLLDTLHCLGGVHWLGEPIVHRILGFSREAGVADRVSEALVIGFLRRDFGAAGLLDMARAGVLTPADIAVSMVTITLFIPCIANVFMIGKERGWKVAAAMSGFIFPYAVAVGAAVRFGFRVFGGS